MENGKKTEVVTNQDEHNTQLPNVPQWYLGTQMYPRGTFIRYLQGTSKKKVPLGYLVKGTTEVPFFWRYPRGTSQRKYLQGTSGPGYCRGTSEKYLQGTSKKKVPLRYLGDTQGCIFFLSW